MIDCQPMLTLIRILSIFFFLTQMAMAGSLSVTEEQIRDYVTHQQQSQIALLKKLVNINSGTTNIAGIYRVGAIVANQLQQLGFKTRWVYEPKSMHRAGTLIAERQGKGQKLLL